MTEETSTSTPDNARGSARRRELLRGAAGAVAAGGLLSGAGGAAAQETGNEDPGNDSGESGDERGPFTNAAISSDAPRLGSENFTGLFLQIEQAESMGEQPDVASCPFIDENQRVATFSAFLISRGDGRSRSERVALYTNAGETDVKPGKLFIVNASQGCRGASGLRQLKLEQIGASRIEVEPQNGTGSGGTTSGSIPGFGAVTALGGLAAAGGAALGLGRSDD